MLHWGFPYWRKALHMHSIGFLLLLIPEHTNNQYQLKIKSISEKNLPVESHQSSPFKKNTRNGHFSGPAETGPYEDILWWKASNMNVIRDKNHMFFTLCVIVYFQKCKEGPYVPYDGITLVWIFENWIIKRRWSVNLGQRLDTKNALKSLIDTVL